MLLQAELDKAQPRQKGIPASLTAEGASDAGEVVPDPNAAVAVAPAAPSESAVRQSHPQAQKFMQTAHLQRRIGTKMAALEACDQVLTQYPDSLEADEAKMLIERILRDNPSLREDRQRAGKYTGP
jgi:hypothetical protein